MLGFGMRRALGLALGMGLCVLATLPGRAQAQGITLNRFSPAETVEDGFVLSRPGDRGHLQPGGVLYLDYANDPLVLEQDAGDAGSESAAIVSDHLALHVGGSLGLWNRLVLFAGLQANLLMEGESFSDPAFGTGVNLADGAGLGDARVGGRLRLFGERDDVFALAVQLTGTLPLGELVDDGQRFAGEEDPSLLPELLGELRFGKLRLTANVGARVRRNADIGTADVQDELLYALGATYSVHERLDLLAEVFGATSFEDFASRQDSPLEALLGGKGWITRGCAVGLAGGAGLLRGIGSPDFRVIGHMGCQLMEPKKEKQRPVLQTVYDTDGDGLLDQEDQCVDTPEDEDGFKDKDGCPDEDNDQDGIPDTEDRCPMEAEDRDGFEDKDGCPDEDNDQDGVLDGDDACPENEEDKDGFEDEDGCPDEDNDQDSVVDTRDKCPMKAGVPSQQGCPKSVRLEKDRIVILERVEFATGKAEILPRSVPVLEEVRATLETNPRIRKIRIEGHTDARGRDASNLELSRRRARSVARWMIEHGISAERLAAFGCGEVVPIESNETPVGRQKNRRVEFYITEPDPKGGARHVEGCKPVEL